jgi:hypothetical protein
MSVSNANDKNNFTLLKEVIIRLFRSKTQPLKNW